MATYQCFMAWRKPVVGAGFYHYGLKHGVKKQTEQERVGRVGEGEWLAECPGLLAAPAPRI